MKVVFFTNQILWGQHYFAILDLMEHHINLGNDVVQVVCDSSIRNCETNVNGNLTTCMECVSKRENGHKLLGKKVRKVHLNDFLKEKKSILNWEGDLRTLVTEEFPLGLSILSTIYTEKKTTIIEESSLRVLASTLVISGNSAYEGFKAILEWEKPDLAITFNGRMLLSRAFISACDYMNIEFRTVDYGCSMKHFIEYNNTLPHDINYTTQNMIKHWESSVYETQAKMELAEKYYDLRRSGSSSRFKNFTMNQIENKLPENWIQAKRNFVVFISSLDEVAAARAEWSKGLFNSQLEGLEFLRQAFQNVSIIHFYIRLHPNLLNKDYNLVGCFIDFFNKHSPQNMTLILPNSDVSSYALIESCEKSICFGSTTGVEATFYEQPSISLAPFYYQNLDVSYFPKTKDDFIKLLLERLDPKPKHGAFIFGFYYFTFGTPFKYFELSENEVYFNNRKLICKSSKKLKILYNLSKLMKKNFLIMYK